MEGSVRRFDPHYDSFPKKSEVHAQQAKRQNETLDMMMAVVFEVVLFLAGDIVDWRRPSLLD